MAAQGAAGSLGRLTSLFEDTPAAKTFPELAENCAVARSSWSFRGLPANPAFGTPVAPSLPMDSEMLTIPHRHTLGGFVVAAEGDAGIEIESLEAGATVVVDTSNSEYRLTVLNRSERTVLVRGGKFDD